MTKSTRFILQIALVAVALSSATGAAIIPAQQGSTRDEWCQESRENSWGNQDRVTHCEVREFTSAASGATLHVNAEPNGGISVTGDSRRDIAIRARVTATARTIEQARAIASRVQVVASPERVQADGPDNLRDREGWSVSYRILAPGDTPLALQSTNGGLSITNINSQIDARTTNGGITLNGVAGDVQGRTSNGGINVNLDGSTWQGQGLVATTSNGGIKLTIPSDYSAHLEAATSNGGINVDFPVTVQGRMRRNISADLGGGGPTLKLTTANGGIRITRK